MKHRFIAKYDFDGKKCMELEKTMVAARETEKWTFFLSRCKEPVFQFK
jgi:hypothetical protein